MSVQQCCFELGEMYQHALIYGEKNEFVCSAHVTLGLLRR